MRLILSVLLLLTLGQRAGAAEPPSAWRYGVAVAYGRQDVFPLGNRSYTHEVRAMKLVAARPLTSRGAFALELQLEPFAAVARHRLRAPGAGPGEDSRSRFTRSFMIRELGVDVGLVARWAPTARLNFFLHGSIGPMYTDTGSERLAEGFAFSDIVGVGVGFRQGGLLTELGPTLRHVSNASLRKPNEGHNTMLLVLAISAAR